MKRCAIIVLPIALSGCVVASEKSAFNTGLITPAITQADAPPGGDAPPPKLTPPASCNPDPTDKTTRNNCMYQIQTLIYDNYINYRLHIVKQVGLTSEGLDVSSSVSSAAAAATTGIANKVLSGLTAAITGSRTAFNNDALYQQSMQAILKQMDADVSSSWAHIQISMQSDFSTYNMYQANSDLLGYFRAGTVEDAVSNLDAAAGTAATTCKTASNAVNTASVANAKIQTPATQTTPSTTSDQCNQIIQSANVAISIAIKNPPVFPEDINRRLHSLAVKLYALKSPTDQAKLDSVVKNLDIQFTPNPAATAAANFGNEVAQVIGYDFTIIQSLPDAPSRDSKLTQVEGIITKSLGS